MKKILFAVFLSFSLIIDLYGQSGVVKLRRNVTEYKSFFYFNYENRAANFSSVDLEWSKVATGQNELHTLKMTFNWTNGKKGSLTLYGGTGTLGDSIIWYPHSDFGDYLIESDFLWPVAEDRRYYSMPEIIWINGAKNGQVNNIFFILADPSGNPYDVFVGIGLDGSFFP